MQHSKAVKTKEWRHTIYLVESKDKLISSAWCERGWNMLETDLLFNQKVSSNHLLRHIFLSLCSTDFFFWHTRGKELKSYSSCVFPFLKIYNGVFPRLVGYLDWKVIKHYMCISFSKCMTGNFTRYFLEKLSYRQNCLIWPHKSR